MRQPTRTQGRHTLVVGISLLLTACGASRQNTPAHYAQSMDSASNSCRHNPRLCTPTPGERMPVVPRPPAPNGPRPVPPLVAGAAATTATGVTRVALDAQLEARIHEALSECANDVRSQVMLKHFGEAGPTAEQCNEKVDETPQGEPITRAMRLGVEQHTLALQCAEKRLSELKPGGCSLSPRYRYDPLKKHTEHIPRERVKQLLDRGQSAQLKGTLEPDIVIHAGHPLKVQATFDFKFPCMNGMQPPWRTYPKGHPHSGLSQKKLYEEALKAEAKRVLPRWGVIP